MTFVEICVPISDSIVNLEEAIEFTEKIDKKVKDRSVEAAALARVIKARRILIAGGENRQLEVKVVF